MIFEWQMGWEEGGRSGREATFFLLSCGAHDFLNCFTVQTLFATGHPHHKLWCGCSKTGQKLSFATIWKKIIQRVGLLFAYTL